MKCAAWAAALGSGVARDAARLRWASWQDDWGTRGKLRILAAATYVCLASAIPALAFGVQASSDTDGLLSPVSVLVATAITGVLQALVGGQPLLIVGVAEPIVLTYGYMYDFAKDREGLGRERFLAWAAWCCVWAASMILVLSLTNACVYIRHFTRLSGELFGMLIALLFLQQAIKGSVEEFRSSSSDAVWVGGSSSGSSSGGSGNGSGEPSVPAPDAATWQLVNGVWSLLLAFGLLLTSLLMRSARSWHFLRAPLRGFLADYGAPLMLLAFTGLSFAVHGSGGSSGSVPRRVHTPNVWDSSPNWTVAADMASLEGRWIAAALIPAALITVLFFFDHNVSAQLAQQEEFNLKKPSAYHWDFMLLGLMTLLCGLLGLPPVNGVLPQAPMHTKVLAKVSGKRRSSSGGGQQQQGGQEAWQQQAWQQQAQQQRVQQSSAPYAGSGTLAALPAAGSVELGTAGSGGKGLAAAGDLKLPAGGARSKSKGLHLSPSAQALLPPAACSSGHSSSSFADLAAADHAAAGGSSSSSRCLAAALDSAAVAAAPLVAAGEVLQAGQGWGKAAGSGTADGAAGAAGRAVGAAADAAGAAGTAGDADPAGATAGTTAGTTAGAADPAGATAGTPAGTTAGAAGAADEVVAVHVYEQRWSGLLQSVGVTAFLFATPAIRQIPTACLWGYFAFMALESLPGSQFWDRLLLLLTDPRKRTLLLEQAHAPYLETVPFRVIAWFTAFQAAYLLLVYGVTWAGVAGILFPLPIMALVPLRQWVLPRCFANKRHLQELDAAREEEAAPLTHEQALQEAAAQGLGTGGGVTPDRSSGEGEGRSSAEHEGSLPDSELHHLRVVHHLSRSSLVHRRSTIEADAAAEPGAADAAAGLPPLPPAVVRSPRAAASLRRRSYELPHV